MSLQFLDVAINTTVVRSIFTILIHSLWLGAVMALLSAIIITLTKRSGPHIRYKLLTAVFFLFTMIITGIFLYSLKSGFNAIAVNSNIAGSPLNNIYYAGTVSQQNNITDTLINFIKLHAAQFVFIWFIIICLKCVQLVSGLYSLHKLRKRNIFQASEYWNERMKNLAAKIRITKPVKLLQSSLAKMPMVIGYLKPVILFPAGILNGLPQNEVEAILLHELAHIKRNDFIINLLQQFVEIIFFFNPAVLWVSSLIKNERENCCDDIAIAVTQDKKIFIHALVSFQEYNAGMAYATGFPGTKNHLLNRVKRIITNNNKTLNSMEKLILASGIIVTCIATLAFTPRQEKDKKQATEQNAEMSAQSISQSSSVNMHNDAAVKYINTIDSVPEIQITEDSGRNLNYSGTIDGKKIELKEENGILKELYVDGKKIPENEFGQYKSLTDKIHQKMQEDIVRLKAQTLNLGQQKIELQKQAELMNNEAARMKEQASIMQSDMKAKEAEMKEQQIEMEKQAILMKQQYDSLMVTQSLNIQQDILKQQEQFKLKEIELQKKTIELKEQQLKMEKMILDSMRVKTVVLAKPITTTVTAVSLSNNPNVATTVHASSNIYVRPAINVSSTIAANQATFINATSKDIIQDLEAENIISTRNNLSFTITNDVLIVNGVKQPEAIHQKMLSRYQKNPGDTISFSYSNNNKGETEYK